MSEVAQFGEEEWQYTQNLCSFITWMSSEGLYRALPASELISRSKIFFQDYQNNINESVINYATFLDAPVEYVDLVIQGPFGGNVNFYVDTVNMVDSVIPLLGHPTQSAPFLPVFVTLTIISSVFLALRFYSRMSIHGWLRSYDWIVFLGFILTLASGIMRVIIVDTYIFYIGYWDMSWVEFDALNASSLANNIMYPVIIFLIKTSLLVFYYRLTAWEPLRYATVATFIVVLCNSLALLLAYVFRCDPVIGWRGMNFAIANCPVVLWKLELSTSIVNIVTDVAIWMIPLPMIWKIVHTTKERIFAVLTFGVGAFACVACGIRLSVMHNGRFSDEVGKIMNSSIVATWTQVELYLAIICSCVPALRALIIKKLPKALGLSDGNDSEENMKGYQENEDSETPHETKTPSNVSV